MRFPSALMALFLMFGVGHLAAQSSSTPDIAAGDRVAIRQVIENQIAAFQRDDASAAFGFASPNIQSMFRTPENFIAMVQQGYPPVYRPQAMTFSEIVGDADGPVQLVDIVGPSGEAVTAAYEMLQLPDGSWRINGCVLLARPRRDA
jgi:hypothetical protein